MSVGFLDDRGKQRFADVIRAIEAGSAAELMVTVRARASRWLHAALLVGIATAIGALAFMLFADVSFSTPSLLADPIVAGVAVGAISTLVPPLARWLTPRAARRAAVATTARALFHDKGVRLTSARIGILLHVSIVEQMAEVVADAGVLTAVPEHEWRAAVERIDAAVRRGGLATAEAALALAPLLARYLPRQTDDRNELADEVCA